MHDLTIHGNRMVGGDQFRIGIFAPANRRRYNNQQRRGVTYRNQNEPFATLSNVDNAVVTDNMATFVSGAWPTRGGRYGSPQGAVMLICSTGVVARNTWIKNPAIVDLVERCP